MLKYSLSANNNIHNYMYFFFFFKNSLFSHVILWKSLSVCICKTFSYTDTKIQTEVKGKILSHYIFNIYLNQQARFCYYSLKKLIWRTSPPTRSSKILSHRPIYKACKQFIQMFYDYYRFLGKYNDLQKGLAKRLLSASRSCDVNRLISDVNKRPHWLFHVFDSITSEKRTVLLFDRLGNWVAFSLSSIHCCSHCHSLSTMWTLPCVQY